MTLKAQVTPAYIVEQYFPNAIAGDVGAFVSALEAAASALSAEGRPVRLVGSILVPDDELCLHLLTAACAEAAAQAAAVAAITPERIVPAAAWFGS